MVSSLNIILFGETGVGKSSVINLIAGEDVAETSLDAPSCTLSCKPYAFDVGGRMLRIWDTVGLEEPELGPIDYLPAIEKAHELISNLTSEGGVDLLLFCIRGNRVSATTQSNYRLFYEVLCRSQAPIALVITHLERETVLEEWWKRNESDLKKFGINVVGHACITGLPRHAKRKESLDNIIELLKGHNGDGRFIMPRTRWFIEFLHLFGVFSPLKREAKREAIMTALTKRCGLDPTIAEKLAEKLQ